jgi:ubiquitin carboxyl-terminal hydrolase 22/27/51
MGSRKRPPSRGGCTHILEILKSNMAKELLNSYELAIKLLFVKEPPSTLKCQVCGDGEVLLCLRCSFVGCLNDFAKNHCKQNPDHVFGVDLSSQEGLTYCFLCEDFVESNRLEIVKNKRVKNILLGGAGNKDLSNGTLDGGSNHALADSIAPSFQATVGLRGFYNMGATCFISVILQSLIHNPFVRNFFLAGGHDSGSCMHNQGSNCIGCCLDKLFQDFYNSNSVSSVGITELLTSSWSVQRSLSGSTEQDAHEFFQFLLQELHESDFKSPVFAHLESEVQESEDDYRESGTNDDDPESSCQCISHRTFYGQLESCIKCLSCETVTTTVDPVMDLSLEIRSRMKKAIVPGQAVTLQDCLDRFTSVEKLDTNYHCSVCNQKRLVEKQLLVKKLPPVLSIQVKRFQHHHYGQSTKVETKVSFPLFLDMSKYTVDGPGRPLTYELFGVICHQGTLNTGHYTCMIKTRLGSWFNFDDSMITKVSTTTVLDANAYLLFYIIHEYPIIGH